MPSDNTTQNHLGDRGADRPNTQLQQVRSRVATLCQRIKASKDPDAIREVQEQLGRVGQLMNPRAQPRRRRQRRGGRRRG